MEQDKLKFLQEKQVSDVAKKVFQKNAKYQTNPLVSKFYAFQKAKKTIESKDLL